MEWDDVRVLLALLRGGSLQAAGARLGVDASTVSRRLASLEASLGAPLFVRGRDGLKPTAAADRMRPAAEAMETGAAALDRAARSTDPRARGVVRVATTDAFARMLVAEGLLDVLRDHPDLVVELLAGNRPVDLVRGEADVALRLAALRQPSLRARCVARVGVGLFAAPAYLRARPALKDTSSLRGHDVLLATGELARLPESRWLAARSGARVVFRSNSMPALVAAASRGHGLVALPLGWGDAEPALERALTLSSVPPRKVWLVVPEAARGEPSVRVVTREIEAILQRMFPGDGALAKLQA